MNSLSASSRVVANDLRRAERSINLAARDTAQFLVTTLDANTAHRLSPTITHTTVKATIGALTALVDSQHHLAFRAHPSLEKTATSLGLTVVDWGVGDPKAVAEVQDEPTRA